LLCGASSAALTNAAMLALRDGVAQPDLARRPKFTIRYSSFAIQ
jgi:hypothetical protein